MAKPVKVQSDIERKIRRTIGRVLRAEIKRMGPITLRNYGPVIEEIWLGLQDRKEFLREPKEDRWQS